MLGSNVIAVLVTCLFGRKKTKADIAGSVVENAIKLSTFAMEHSETSNQRYSDVAMHLELCEKHLLEARKQLLYEKEHNSILAKNCEILQAYIETLKSILRDNGIVFPECQRLLVMRERKDEG